MTTDNAGASGGCRQERIDAMGWKERLRSEGLDLTRITDETTHRSPTAIVPPDHFR